MLMEQSLLCGKCLSEAEATEKCTDVKMFFGKTSTLDAIVKTLLVRVGNNSHIYTCILQV